MTVVGAILHYSHIEPTFDNSSHGQPLSTRPTASLSAEDHILFIILPNHHIWGPHTIQRAVFSTSSRSRASTTLVVDHFCAQGCREHSSQINRIHVPLLRKVEDIPCPDRSRIQNWRHFIDRSSQSLARPLSRLIQRGERHTNYTPTSESDRVADYRASETSSLDL